MNDVMKHQETMNAMPYEAPQVEVIEVAVEKGYAFNGSGSDSDDSEFGY